MSGNPKQSQKMSGGNVIQSLSALLYQRWRCLGSLKGSQSRLTVRTNTKISSSLEFIWISWAKVTYNSVRKTEAYFPTEILSLLPYDCPQTPVPGSPSVLGPSVYQISLLLTGESQVVGPLFSSGHSNPTLGFKVKCWPHKFNPHKN